MILKWKLFLFNVVCVSAKIQPLFLKDLDYPLQDFRSSPNKYNLRRKFLDKRRQNIVTAKRVEIIDTYLSNKSVFVEGIAHEKIDEKHKQLNLVSEMEKAFKDLIEMNGVKYYYKRDPYWRTWRKVKYPDGDRMICYRCDSSLKCTDCQYAGYWVIDEAPPCPYEIISVHNITDVCAIENSTNTEKPCPSVVHFTDIMRQCDNPIYTLWRVQKSYKKEVSERYPVIICGGRDYCQISTFYKITSDYVSFRIINSTNHIIYSRIMKNNQTNYACVSDCGTLDPNTKIVSKTDKPLVVDLINRKKKRDDKTKDSTIVNETQKTEQDVIASSTVCDENTPRIDQSHETKDDINDKDTVIIITIETDTGRRGSDRDYHHHHHHNKKHPTCSSLRHRTEEELSDEANIFY